MRFTADSIKVALSILVVSVLTFSAFAVFSGQRGSQVRTVDVTAFASPYLATPTQVPYPLPSIPAVTPSPTYIIKLTPRPSVVGPPPCCTPQLTSLSAVESLRQTLMRFPAEKRMTIDQDTIAVILIGKGDVHDPTETRDRMVIVVHYVPSLSVISIDISNNIISRNYKTLEGQNRLESIIANPVLMAQLNAFLIAYVGKLPK